MNILISGYGKMGKEIEALALQRGHTILAKIDRNEEWDGAEVFQKNHPVVIDFSQPDVVKNNILSCFQYQFPVVVGTTGWNEHLQAMIETCKDGGHTLFTASNFSIGMNLFFALNQHLAGLMNDHGDYDVSIQETHHVHKLDKPSGTAITLAEQLLNVLNRKNEWTMDMLPSADQVFVEAMREGEVFGEHAIKYESPIDQIEIKHTAKNRKGFALGAVMAAEWLQGKTGYFEMKDFLGIQ